MEIDLDKTLDVGVEWRAAAQAGGAERRGHRWARTTASRVA